jgi:DNA polymerase
MAKQRNGRNGEQPTDGRVAKGRSPKGPRHIGDAGRSPEGPRHIRDAGRSAKGPRHSGEAARLIPDRPTLPRVREAARQCQACDLWKRGTQTVFGEGAGRAGMMLVGEQPGNDEDLAGHPFVGPAGRLLDRALHEAGIDRSQVYVTNVVKHFKWEPRGKRRIHKKPNSGEIAACRPWLDTEIALVQPRVIVCLGATAAQAVIDPKFKVTAHRGEFVPSTLAAFVTATVHPSSILRAPDDESRHRDMAQFIADLRRAAKALA